MHTLLINDRNNIITTNAERIIQNTKLVHTICIRAKNEYNGVKMNECTAILLYRFSSKDNWHSFKLTPMDELYNNIYVEYQFQTDTWVTMRTGDMHIKVRFYKTDPDEQDSFQYIREAIDGIIRIYGEQDNSFEEIDHNCDCNCNNFHELIDTPENPDILSGNSFYELIRDIDGTVRADGESNDDLYNFYELMNKTYIYINGGSDSSSKDIVYDGDNFYEL